MPDQPREYYGVLPYRDFPLRRTAARRVMRCGSDRPKLPRWRRRQRRTRLASAWVGSVVGRAAGERRRRPAGRKVHRRVPHHGPPAGKPGGTFAWTRSTTRFRRTAGLATRVTPHGPRRTLSAPLPLNIATSDFRFPLDPIIARHPSNKVSSTRPAARRQALHGADGLPL